MKVRGLARVAGVWSMLAASLLSALGQSGVEVDPDGNTIPSPTGNIPYFSLPGALAAGSGESTWDYSGTLEAGTGQRFSFMSSIFDVDGPSDFGFHIFQLGWKDGNQDVYFNANSTYGSDGLADVIAAIGQSIDTVRCTANFAEFSLTASTDFSPGNGWEVFSDAITPVPPLCKGWVGQPGHAYAMVGTGTTFLWRYAADGSSVVLPYRYKVALQLYDERGAVMEGVGGGYVGPALVPTPIAASYNTESEIGQPRLRVTAWSVTLTADETIPAEQEGKFRSTYEFSGTAGLLWNDFGPVVPFPSSAPPTTADYAEFTAALPTDSANQVNRVATSVKAKGLYTGNWLPVHFTTGKYEGCTLVASVFWSKDTPRPANQTTDSFAWAKAGWINLYTGFIPGKPASASSLTATLYAENPAIPTAAPKERPPFTVSLDAFVPPAYTDGSGATIGFPWAQTVTIRIHPRTKLRYALADYANTYFPQRGRDNPDAPLVIKLKAISPVSQNTLFSPSITQYYEGAAVPSVDGKVVGYGWIEHMVND
jgi:hypothetical protein